MDYVIRFSNGERTSVAYFLEMDMVSGDRHASTTYSPEFARRYDSEEKASTALKKMLSGRWRCKNLAVWDRHEVVEYGEAFSDFKKPRMP